jgi:hypothetical protein
MTKLISKKTRLEMMNEKLLCMLEIKKCEQKKLLALAAIQGEEIKILEHEYELGLCKTEIEKQEEVCKGLDKEIEVQKQKAASFK